jgi:hypothetical protein
MTLHGETNLDLPRHAAAKVKRALDDVLQLTNDPAEMIQIAVMAASIPIGAASGFLRGKMARAGVEITETAAIIELLEVLKLHFTKQQAVHGERTEPAGNASEQRTSVGDCLQTRDQMLSGLERGGISDE